MELPDLLEKPLSRRSFLKYALFGFAGLGLLPRQSLFSSPPLALDNGDLPLGRVADASLVLHAGPSLESKKLKKLWRDVVLPIREVRVGGEEPAHNRVWYNLNDEGYAHSGAVQPVRILTNPPDAGIPAGGRLGEVTVPFTDARWFNKPDSSLAYRLYYATTHWITALVHDALNTPWYKIDDDRLKVTYFVNASHVRLIRDSELAPLAPGIPAQGKRIEVRLAQQILVAYELERPVFMARIASGGEYSNGSFLTPTGHHMTLSKRPTRHMAAGDRAAPNSYDLPGVPWICYFDENGTALHGTYWHNDYGRPRSHGCVNLTPQAARWVYRWTQPVVPPGELKRFEPVGTVVDIF
jgi:hypothetical protein